MDKATFKVDAKPAPSGAGPAGRIEIEFIAQTNPGLAPTTAPQDRIRRRNVPHHAGLKSVLSEGDRVSVLVFDEIDANVGGRLGSAIGNKLRELANHHQVLCITHLPQIASYADWHLTVRKQTTGKTTSTTVRVVQAMIASRNWPK